MLPIAGPVRHDIGCAIIIPFDKKNALFFVPHVDGERLGSIFDFRRCRPKFLKGGPVGDHQVSLFRDEEPGWPCLVP
jgi:hypothetical protein